MKSSFLVRFHCTLSKEEHCCTTLHSKVLHEKVVEMLASIPNRTPQQSPAFAANHIRANSSPYFQNTRTFTEFESGPRSHPLPAPVSCHVSATALRTSPARLQRHNRSHTESSIPKLPTITTDIKIESVPAVLPISVFSKSNGINFDLSPPDSPVLSPENEKDKWNFIPNFKIDKGSPQRSPSPLRISTWFQGESAPVTLGMAFSPTKESPDPISASTKSMSDPLKPNKANSFFSSLFATKATVTASPPRDMTGDEFYNLDIKRAIQPHGPADPFSPSSFKNLQQNAEGLLARMQIAYRHKVQSIANARAEQEAQEEELEEAQTRAQHLKSQLDTLSSRLDERNQEMDRLMKELEEEKRLRQEEMARNRTIRFVSENTPFDRPTRSRASLGSNASVPSMLSDGGSTPSELSDTAIHGSGAMSSPQTPRSIAWSQDLQYELPGQSHKSLGHISHALDQEASTQIQENVELRARVGYLEKELDSCLEILKGIGL